MVNEVQTTAELCDELIAQYREARVAVRERLGGSTVAGTAACGPSSCLSPLPAVRSR